MIVATTRTGAFRSLGRLDAWYHLAPGAAAARSIDGAKSAGIETARIGGEGGLGRTWMPGRLKQVLAVPEEEGVPYLKPHDAFQYLPSGHGTLAVSRTPRLADYRVERGWILQTRSGRNLGPNVLIDSYLEKFAFSDDLIRIDIPDERLRYYIVAFLRSIVGQGLLRRDKNGSVIDHLSPAQIEAHEIPILDPDTVDRSAQLIGLAFDLTEQARTTLSESLASYEASLPGPTRRKPAKGGWTVRANAMSGRLDAAFYDPWIDEVRSQLLASGGQRVDAVAEVLKPPGRYKTIYVSEEFGRPFMSGTQILQLIPVKLQYMAERVFKDVRKYELQEGWSVFMADGRAEKDLGVVAMVPPDRRGWIASGHVGRLVPRAGTDPGWLWLAARTWHVQAQIKALASGSVVDSTYPADMESVILPPDLGVDGKAITSAWAKFARARDAEAEATALVDSAFATITGTDNAKGGEE